MSGVNELEFVVSQAIESGDYRTVIITTKQYLKRNLTQDKVDDLTKNCSVWRGEAFMAASQGASAPVVESLVEKYISIGDGVNADRTARLNERKLRKEEVDKVLKIAIKKRCTLQLMLRIASLGISQQYFNELLLAYKTLQKDVECNALLKLKTA